MEGTLGIRSFWWWLTLGKSPISQGWLWAKLLVLQGPWRNVFLGAYHPCKNGNFARYLSAKIQVLQGPWRLLFLVRVPLGKSVMLHGFSKARVFQCSRLPRLRLWMLINGSLIVLASHCSTIYNQALTVSALLIH